MTVYWIYLKFRPRIRMHVALTNLVSLMIVNWMWLLYPSPTWGLAPRENAAFITSADNNWPTVCSDHAQTFAECTHSSSELWFFIYPENIHLHFYSFKYIRLLHTTQNYLDGIYVLVFDIWIESFPRPFLCTYTKDLIQLQEMDVLA